MSVFTREGDHVRTFKVLSEVTPETHRPPLPRVVAPSGAVWGTFSVNVGSVALGRVSESPVVLMAEDGSMLRELRTDPLTGTMQVATYDGGVSMFLQPLRRTRKVGFAADGSAAVVARTTAEGHDGAGRFSVTRVDPAGDTVFHRWYRHPPLAVSAEARDSIMSSFARTVFERAGGRALAVAQEHVEVPELQPPVTAVVVDAAGRTWLRREELRPQALWVALDPEGRIEGALYADPHITVHQAAGDVLWGVVEDAMEVPYVVKYRLVPEGR